MSGEQDPQFQSLQIETCTAKFLVNVMKKQEGNFELTSQMFV
jgi:hypothetical protein